MTVNLRETSELVAEHVAVDQSQVRQVMLRLARDLEDLAAGSGTSREGPGLIRQERLADLAPAPPRLSPYEERLQLRRRLGLDP